MAKDALVKINRNMELPEIEGTHYRLLCMTGKNKGTSYYLKGKRVVMGRGQEANVQIYDEKASREHAELSLVGENYFITDLGSQNGVTVNDLKITQYELKDNDKIIIGKTVYKFSKIFVKGGMSLVESDMEENDSEEDDDENKKPNKRKILIGVIILGLIYVFLAPENYIEQEKNNEQVDSIGDTVDSRLVDLFKKTAVAEDDTNKKKLRVILERGLREYRERNYFRALDEFELALILSPNNGVASFYKNRTLQRIDEEIKQNFIKAKQEEGALKYSSAKISYCAIIRLLVENQDDERFIRAEKSLRELERKLGVEEGDLKCIER